MSGKSKKQIAPEPSKGPGAPTKFKPEYCQRLIEHMKEGKSYETFGPVVGVNRSTLFDWESQDQPGWKDAKEMAFDLALSWWEDQGRDGLWSTTEYENGKPSSSRQLNGAVWIFQMKNRFKWRDKQPDEGADVNINLTLSERMAKARARAGKVGA